MVAKNSDGYLLNPWKHRKKVPRRHQSLSGGSTLSAFYRKLLWDQPSIFPLWSSWRVKFSNKKFQILEILCLILEKNHVILPHGRLQNMFISITAQCSVLLNTFVWLSISVGNRKIFWNKFKIFMKKSRFLGKNC